MFNSDKGRMERIGILLERCRANKESMLREKLMKKLLREIISLEDSTLESELLIFEGTNAFHLWVEGSLRVMCLIDKFTDIDIHLYITRLQNLIDKLYILLEQLPSNENYFRPHVVYAAGTCEFFLFQLRMKYDPCFEKNIFLTSLVICLNNLRQELNDSTNLRGMKYLYANDMIDPETFEMFEKSINPRRVGGVTVRKKGK